MKTLEERFWEKVKKGDGCWEWTGARNTRGYGTMYISGKTVSVHRLSFEIAIGHIPPGMLICHKCDNPPCVNPAHLFAGTHTDNMRDKMKKGRGGNLIGGEHSRSKLKAVSIPAIRQAILMGVPQTAIAEGYGVSGGCINKIHAGDSWGHVI